MHQTIRRRSSSASATVPSSTPSAPESSAYAKVPASLRTCFPPGCISTGLALQRPGLTGAGRLDTDQTAGRAAKGKVRPASAIDRNPRLRHISFRHGNPKTTGSRYCGRHQRPPPVQITPDRGHRRPTPVQPRPIVDTGPQCSWKPLELHSRPRALAIHNVTGDRWNVRPSHCALALGPRTSWTKVRSVDFCLRA